MKNRNETAIAQPEISPEVLAMYSIPGYESVSNKTLERYLRSKKQYEEDIVDAYKESLEYAIISGDSDRIKSLIEFELNHGNEDRKVKAFESIIYAPKSDWAPLLELALSSENPAHQIVQDEMISSMIETGRRDVQRIIDDAVLNAIEVNDIDTIQQQINFATPQIKSRVTEYIRESNEDSSLEIVLSCPDIVPDSELPAILKKLLESDNPIIAKRALYKTAYVPGDQRLDFLGRALEHTDPTVQRVATTQLMKLETDEEREKFLAQILKRYEVLTSKILVDLEDLVKNSPTSSVFFEMLNESDYLPFRLFANKSGYYFNSQDSSDELTDLINEASEAPNKKPQLMLQEICENLPPENRKEIILRGIGSQHLSVIRAASENIRIAHESERETLARTLTERVRTFLIEAGADSTVRVACFEILENVTAEDLNAVNSISDECVAISLETGSTEELKALASIIGSTQQENFLKYMSDALSHKRQEVRNAFGWAILEQNPPSDTLLTLLKKSGVDKELIEGPLYESVASEETYFRKDFEKTGSETTLLGGSLQGKVIMRHITPGAFLAWQQAYEAHQSWKDAGFEYVPIEPIIAFTPSPEHRVNVASGVLDVSFNTWIHKTELFKVILQTQVNDITRTLSDMNVEHGHPHEDNFILRFYRDEDGSPDFTKTPRVYLIDFDSVTSVAVQNR